MTTHLFKPLDMDRTTTRLADIESESNVAHHLIDYAGTPLDQLSQHRERRARGVDPVDRAEHGQLGVDAH